MSSRRNRPMAPSGSTTLIGILRICGLTINLWNRGSMNRIGRSGGCGGTSEWWHGMSGVARRNVDNGRCRMKCDRWWRM
jgi:hypothetical protein